MNFRKLCLRVFDSGALPPRNISVSSLDADHNSNDDMAFLIPTRTFLRQTQWRHVSRSLTTSTSEATASSLPPPQPTPTASPNTHYKITLRRSAISLGDKIKGTLISLGIHRRMQTVYHRHSPEVAGKILRVKELVEVENVPTELVKTKEEQTLDRKATRGYKVIGNRRKNAFIGV
jgi:large subunit ribosomal protein L30